MPSPPLPAPSTRPPSLNRLHTLTAGYRELRARLEQGGGPDKVRRQHEQGKLTARERIEALLDQGATWFELGLLVASDQYDGQARSEEHTSELQSRSDLVCRLLLEKKKNAQLSSQA